MPSVLITGANSGLGLEFTRQLLRLGWSVHACCRKPERADDLRALRGGTPESLNIHAVDLADFVSIDNLATKLASAPIDLLINNAGVMDTTPIDFSEDNRRKVQVFGALNHSSWSEVFLINVIGTTRLTEVVLPNLQAGSQRKIVMISSIMGSIEACSPNRFPPGGGLYLYRSSKAALNMISRNLAADLASCGFTVLSVNPGWVKTAMGGRDAMLDPETSVGNMIKVISSATSSDNGSFISHDGARLPW
ncbi:SDR family oxidoreductase [Aquisediminimonas profunda]|uniref:SDR family oxidoreductase n=1 Tax=Aquisediminimonas profunda TaxID=1550733 RepID=UPI001C63B37B|nr:SDR family oxidoreductase [Aquisediminimonas profunda]